MRLNIGLLYLSLHNLLKKKIGVNRTITRKDFFTILGKHFLIPKNIRVCIVKEMELMKLIQKVDRDTLKVLSYDLDIETDANKFYQTLKLFS
jgi:hypothetical protein